MIAALLSVVLICLLSQQVVGYGEPDASGRPNYQERANHVFANAARIAPTRYKEVYMAGFSPSVATIMGTTYPAVPPLYLEPKLVTAAFAHSNDMAVNKCFQHNSCDGTATFTRVKQYYTCSGTLGENIAAGNADPLDTNNQWLCDKSGSVCAADGSSGDGHRRSIMSGSYKVVGTGYAYDSAAQYRHYWTQDFGGTSCAPAPTSPVYGGSHRVNSGSTLFIAVYYTSPAVAPSSAQVVVAGTTYNLVLDLGVAGAGTYKFSQTAGTACRSYYFLFGSVRYPETGCLVTYNEGGCTVSFDANCATSSTTGSSTTTGTPTTPPTPRPTPRPTSPPTSPPTTPPTSAPTNPPTNPPTPRPTPPPTNPPTSAPTSAPTDAPTSAPTSTPTDAPPTSAPTSPPPTGAPTSPPPTGAPTSAPTSAPPTSAPTRAPTSPPTSAPPTGAPTSAPTRAPTGAPTSAPTKAPTSPPTPRPTTAPTSTPGKYFIYSSSLQNQWTTYVNSGASFTHSVSYNNIVGLKVSLGSSSSTNFIMLNHNPAVTNTFTSLEFSVAGSGKLQYYVNGGYYKELTLTSGWQFVSARLDTIGNPSGSPRGAPFPAFGAPNRQFIFSVATGGTLYLANIALV